MKYINKNEGLSIPNSLSLVYLSKTKAKIKSIKGKKL